MIYPNIYYRAFYFSERNKKFINNSILCIAKNFDLPAYSHFVNNGTLIIGADMNIDHTTGWSTHYSTLLMNSEDAIIRVGGNIACYSKTESFKANSGKLILDGNSKQIIDNINSNTIIIENTSDEGVVFNSSMSTSVLFDHQGNNFTLYDNGSGSSFVDYDGDGLNDNVDPVLTVGNPCTLNFKSENQEKGYVSTERIETVAVQRLPLLQHLHLNMILQNGLIRQAKRYQLSQNTVLLQKVQKPILQYLLNVSRTL